MTHKLRRPLPPNRTYEQVRNHYEVEKSLADRLKKADREERKGIYATMYDELFLKVPDHPRLTRRADESLTTRANREKYSVVRRQLGRDTVFAEFAPGDCRFSFHVAPHVKEVYGIDISDQRNPADKAPANFRLIVYDGYDLSEMPDSSIDVVFSDQLIEHFHPADTRLHFQLAHRILKPSGKYVFRTPHLYNGPHDISVYFADEPQGFHLKEWTYRELRKLVREVGFSGFQSYWNASTWNVRLPYVYFALCERMRGVMPRKLFRMFIKTVCAVAVK